MRLHGYRRMLDERRRGGLGNRKEKCKEVVFRLGLFGRDREEDYMDMFIHFYFWVFPQRKYVKLFLFFLGKVKYITIWQLFVYISASIEVRMG